MSKFNYLTLVTALAVTSPASASLLGWQVTGSLEFPTAASGVNVFNPGSGYGGVPSGSLNENGITVTIQEPAIEFGYEDDGNVYTANFTGTTLTIHDVVKMSSSASGNPNSPFDMTFTSVVPGLFDLISLIPGDGFTPLLTYSLTGDTITIDWTGGNVAQGDEFVAVFEIKTNAVPEPATLALMGIGLAGMISLSKRRQVPAASV